MTKVCVAVLTAVLLCVMAQVATAAPSVYLKLKANGSDIPGDSPVVSLGRENSIQCLSFSLGVKTPRASNGQLTGQRQHESLVITKTVDRASVLLLKALTDNQVCDCEFRFFRAMGVGQEQHHYTVTLKNAFVSAIHQRVSEEDAAGGPPAPVIEEIEFTYSQITWTWVDGGLTHQDKVPSNAGGASGTPPTPQLGTPQPRLPTIKPKPEG